LTTNPAPSKITPGLQQSSRFPGRAELSSK
jgi:hypothetical protein